MNINELTLFLNNKVDTFNNKGFIKNDPIQIPHLFTKKQDIEIAGLFASILAWGNRTTIIKNCTFIITCMDNAPYDFILNHKLNDLKRFKNFVHRTFNETDLYYFIYKLNLIYNEHASLENLFYDPKSKKNEFVKNGLIKFNSTFLNDVNCLKRTQKHISNPLKGSACKRLIMYMRWMIRKDDQGVDFGLWNKIPISELYCPLDVHVQRQALKLNLMKSTKPNWKAAEELINNLRKIDPTDPARFDFALFGLGIEKN